MYRGVLVILMFSMMKEAHQDEHCNLRKREGSPNKYEVKLWGEMVVRSCAANSEFNEDACACVHTTTKASNIRGKYITTTELEKEFERCKKIFKAPQLCDRLHKAVLELDKARREGKGSYG